MGELTDRLAAEGLSIPEAEALLDEALLIEEVGDDLALVAWQTGNDLLVKDPSSVVGAGWLAVHEWCRKQDGWRVQ